MFFACLNTYSQIDRQKSVPKADSRDKMFIGIPEELENKVSEFFDDIISGKIKNGFDKFLKESPVKEKNDQIEKLIAQVERANDIYGKIKDYEPVSSEKVTESYLRLRYLGMNSKLPMRWIFTFYKSPAAGWIVINIELDDFTEYFFSDE